jgi:hypothetical protein
MTVSTTLLACAFDAEVGIRQRFQPGFRDGLAAALADSVMAGIDARNGVLDLRDFISCAIAEKIQHFIILGL